MKIIVMKGRIAIDSAFSRFINMHASQTKNKVLQESTTFHWSVFDGWLWTHCRYESNDNVINKLENGSTTDAVANKFWNGNKTKIKVYWQTLIASATIEFYVSSPPWFHR